MYDFFNGVIYCPILKCKQGECRALGSQREKSKRLIAPILVLPPSGDFDHETGRRLGPIEHIRAFGARLYAHWGRRPVFVDGAHIDDAEHKAGLAVHPLTELLERARLEGALAFPVTGLRRSAEYQRAVAKFITRHPEFAICLRVEMLDIDSRNLNDDLMRILSTLRCNPSHVFLVLDLGAITISEDDVPSFTELLLNRINEFPRLHDWLNFAVSATSFPSKIVYGPGSCQVHGRVDWQVYERLVAMRKNLLRKPIFSDYAVEYPAYKKIGRVIPTANLRYSTHTNYHVEKGKTVRKPNGYEAIHPVAAALVARPDFMGRAFSTGDAFMERLAEPGARPGTASTWRWAATDHHIALVIKSLGGVGGTIAEEAVAGTDLEPPLFR